MSSRKTLVDLDFNSAARAVNLLDPASPQDAATMGWTLTQITGLSDKGSCRAASQANVNVAAPGATLDGITLASLDRVLLRAQTAPAENGIYVFNGAASPLTRSTDADTARELEGAIILTEEGTASAGVCYRQTAVNFVLGTDPISWTVFGGNVGTASTSSAGIGTVADQTATDAGSDALKWITPATLAAWSSGPKRYSTTIGDGSSTSFAINHNLNSYNVIVEVFLNSGNRDTVFVNVQRTSVNQVTIVTAPSVPTTNQYAVVVKY